ncbi:MAG: hypothetical protein MHMPM18_000811 [Marteilia pararefringens]
MLKQQYMRIQQYKEVGLSEVTNVEEMGSSQGSLKCLCKGDCNGMRCKCRKNSIL